MLSKNEENLTGTVEETVDWTAGRGSVITLCVDLSERDGATRGSQIARTVSGKLARHLACELRRDTFAVSSDFGAQLESSHAAHPCRKRETADRLCRKKPLERRTVSVLECVTRQEESE